MHKVAIADDNTLLRQNIVDRVSGSFDVVYSSDNANELIAFLDQCPSFDFPELILMDIEMDEMDGIAATGILKEKFPSIKVIMLTVFAQEEKVWLSIMAGADGYILKDEPKDRLVLHMQDVLQGGGYMSPSIARKAMAMLKQGGRNPVEELNEDLAQLTRREFEVLEMISRGYSYKQMADELYISPATAKTHINNIYKKLQVNNRIQALHKAKVFSFK